MSISEVFGNVGIGGLVLIAAATPFVGMADLVIDLGGLPMFLLLGTRVTVPFEALPVEAGSSMSLPGEGVPMGDALLLATEEGDGSAGL